MAAGAFIAQGTKVYINDIKIAGVKGLGGPTTVRPQIDVSDFDSTAREYRAGLKDQGEFRFPVNLVPTDPGQTEIVTRLDDQNPQAFRVEFPNNIEVLEFQGVVTGFERSADVDAPVEAQVTIRISGDVTRTIGA
jgi:hypothetical protein